MLSRCLVRCLTHLIHNVIPACGRLLVIPCRVTRIADWLRLDPMRLWCGQIMYVIDYEALSALSTLAAAVATFGAIAVALWQSARARSDMRRQLHHQNWLEQKKIEEQHLARMLDIVDHPYITAQEFYFSFLRLLGPVTLGLPTPEGLDHDIRRELDGLARRGVEAERMVGSYLNIMLALREFHQQRGDESAAKEFDNLVREVNTALNTGGRLREWLADPDVVLSIHPNQYFDLPQVVAARDAAHVAARTIARRVVRVYADSTLAQP